MQAILIYRPARRVSSFEKTTCISFDTNCPIYLEITRLAKALPHKYKKIRQFSKILMKYSD